MGYDIYEYFHDLCKNSASELDGEIFFDLERAEVWITEKNNQYRNNQLALVLLDKIDETSLLESVKDALVDRYNGEVEVLLVLKDHEDLHLIGDVPSGVELKIGEENDESKEESDCSCGCHGAINGPGSVLGV